MEELNNYLTFSLNDLSFAIPLNFVERAFRAVEITILPSASSNIMGVINIHGSVIPVLNLRRLFQLPERDLSIYDQFILGKGTKSICLWVDAVQDVIQRSSVQITKSEKISSESDFVSGAMNFKQGVIFFIDPNCFFTLNEKKNS